MRTVSVYPPNRWSKDLQLCARHGLSMRQAIEITVERRERWLRVFLIETVCALGLDNPFASDDAIRCIANRALRDVRNRKLSIREHEQLGRTLRACSEPRLHHKKKRIVPVEAMQERKAA